MAKYILSPNAQKSLKEIKEYSLETFGKRQTLIYLEELNDKMKYLAENPQRGKIRNNIKQGYYSAYQGSHIIFYLIKTDHIAIIDILHKSMESALHL